MNRFLVAALVVVACSGDSRDDVLQPLASDSAGVQIIRNPSMHEHLPLGQVLRLGIADGEGPELFSQVYALAIDERGDVFVGNNATGTVRQFDPTGSFVTEFGGRGNGPAEVRMVNGLVVGGDTVVLVDYQQRVKLVLFSISSGFLNSYVKRDSGGIRLIPVARTEKGWLWRRLATSVPPVAVGEAYTGQTAIVQRTFTDTGIGVELYRHDTITLYGSAGEGVELGFFSAGRFSGVDGSGKLYVTAPNEYRIDVFDGASLRRSIRRDHVPVSVSSRDVDALKEALVHVIDTLSRLPDGYRAEERVRVRAMAERRAELPVPSELSPFTGILVSRDGSFWVGREPVAPVEREVALNFAGFGHASTHETLWDCFDSGGLYVGSVVLPARFRPEAVNGLSVVGVMYDDMDVEYVVRFDAQPQK